MEVWISFRLPVVTSSHGTGTGSSSTVGEGESGPRFQLTYGLILDGHHSLLFNVLQYHYDNCADHTLLTLCTY